MGHNHYGCMGCDHDYEPPLTDNQLAASLPDKVILARARSILREQVRESARKAHAKLREETEADLVKIDTLLGL